jgi:Spy/CpxP family protein refolding chaperone
MTRKALLLLAALAAACGSPVAPPADHAQTGAPPAARMDEAPADSGGARGGNMMGGG